MNSNIYNHHILAAYPSGFLGLDRNWQRILIINEKFLKVTNDKTLRP